MTTKEVESKLDKLIDVIETDIETCKELLKRDYDNIRLQTEQNVLFRILGKIYSSLGDNNDK